MAARTYPIADGLYAVLCHRRGARQPICKLWRRSARRIEDMFHIWDPLHDALGTVVYAIIWGATADAAPLAEVVPHGTETREAGQKAATPQSEAA